MSTSGDVRSATSGGVVATPQDASSISVAAAQTTHRAVRETLPQLKARLATLRQQLASSTSRVRDAQLHTELLGRVAAASARDVQFLTSSLAAQRRQHAAVCARLRAARPTTLPSDVHDTVASAMSIVDDITHSSSSNGFAGLKWQATELLLQLVVLCFHASGLHSLPLDRLALETGRRIHQLYPSNSGAATRRRTRSMSSDPYADVVECCKAMATAAGITTALRYGVQKQ